MSGEAGLAVSLKKKILLSFLAGAAIMAVLSAFLYANFAEIRSETAFLELTDTVRSKSLQLRRHEKNYLLYAPAAGADEAAAIVGFLRTEGRKIAGYNVVGKVIRRAPCPVLVVGDGAC